MVLFLLNMGLLFSIKIIIPLYYFFLINVGFSKPTSLYMLTLILSWIGLNKFQPQKCFTISSTSGTINEYKLILELCWIWLFNHIIYIFFKNLYLFHLLLSSICGDITKTLLFALCSTINIMIWSTFNCITDWLRVCLDTTYFVKNWKLVTENNVAK